MVEIRLNEDCWVRWGEFAGRTPWHACYSVSVTENWLILDLATGGRLLIPNHLVRSPAEIRTTDPALDTTPSPL